jgi:tetratricopeptide (TPR) repeat protein
MAGALAEPSLRPFVGRGAEHAAIVDLLAAARARRGGVVLVAGDAGIGKTRLVEEATTSLPPGRVHWGRCHETEGAPAYWPWTQALRSYVRSAPAERLRAEIGHAGPELARVVPAVRAHCPEVGGIDAFDANPEVARFQLFDAVTTFLRAAATDELLVIVLDDLHWADSESLLLLGFVARELRDAALLVVGTYREVEMRQAAAVPRILGDLARTSHAVRLGPLVPSDVARYVETSAGHPVDDDVVQAIQRTTEGNAYFLTEVVRLLQSEGRLDAAATLPARLLLPDGVRDLVRRRIEPLPPETRRLLEAAAVLGRNFDLPVLAHMLDAKPPHILELAGPALAIGALSDATETPGRLRFAHALLQETLVADLPARDRAELHRRAAEALEAVHSGARDALLGELAHHYFQAAALGTLPQAVECATRAGYLAYAQLGYEEAAGHFERALQASRTGTIDAATRLRLLIAFGQAQEAAGDEDGARATLVEAAQLARELRDAGAFGKAVAVAAESATTGLVDVAMIELLEEAVQRAGPGDTRRRALHLAQLARALYFSDTERRHACSAEALAIARRVGDAFVLHHALQARHFALWEPGTVDERRALGIESLALARDVGLPLSLAEEFSWRIVDHLELGDMTVVDETMRQYRDLAARCRLPRVAWHQTVVEAALAQLAGRLDDAERLAHRAASLRVPSVRNNVAPFLGVQLYLVYEERGRLEELKASIQVAAERATTTLPIWRAALANLHAILGERDEAQAVMASLAARGFTDLPLDGNLLGTLARLAEVAARLGEREWAEALLPLVAPHADVVVVLATAAGSLGSTARYAGLLAHATGRVDAAVAHYEAALAVNARIGALPQHAHTQHDLACTLRLRAGAGDAERAAALDADAARTAKQLGLVELGRRLEAGADAPRPAAPGPRLDLSASVARLRREGDVWTIACGEELTRLKDTKGVSYLAELLRHPGREFHALELGGVEEQLRGGDAGEMLDAEARRAYRQRLESLRGELAEAEEFNDLGRTERLREEMEMLTDELGRASGLGGRVRRAGSEAERARLNVTRAVRAVIKKVLGDCPALGRHLDRAVQTGVFCAYEPDPAFPLRWEV